MTERTRLHLRQEYADGSRPSGADFADLFDSFLNKQDDGLSIDAGDNTLVLNRGLRLGDSADAQAGTLRFNAGNLEVHDGTNFVGVGSGGGGGEFAPTAGGNAAYSAAGNVGIGTDFAAAEPTFRLEVPLAANTGPSEQVRFGNATVFNGTGPQQGSAHFAHQSHANNTEFGLRQAPNGEVTINAPLNVPISMMHGGSSANRRLVVTGSGQILIATPSPLVGDANTMLHVDGQAVKSAGGGNWDVASDIRVKEDVADYTAGLETICSVRPVSYRYNGRAGTSKGAPGIGIIGQEIEKVMPETVRVIKSDDTRPDGIEDMRIFNSNALVFALVNAVKELSARLEDLEGQLHENAAPAHS